MKQQRLFYYLAILALLGGFFIFVLALWRYWDWARGHQALLKQGGYILLLTLVLYWALAGTLSLRNVRDSRKNGIFLFLILSVLFGLHGLLYAWNDGELEAQLRLASRIVESGLMMWLGIYQLINLGTD